MRGSFQTDETQGNVRDLCTSTEIIVYNLAPSVYMHAYRNPQDVDVKHGYVLWALGLSNTNNFTEYEYFTKQ